MDEQILKEVIRAAIRFFSSKNNVKEFRKTSSDVANTLNINDVEFLQEVLVILAVLIVYYEETSKSKIMFQC